MTLIEDYKDDLDKNATETLKDITRSLENGVQVIDEYRDREQETRKNRDKVGWEDYTRNQALHELVRVQEALRHTIPRIRDLLNAKIAAEQLGEAEAFLDDVKEELNRRAEQKTSGGEP